MIIGIIFIAWASAGKLSISSLNLPKLIGLWRIVVAVAGIVLVLFSLWLLPRDDYSASKTVQVDMSNFIGRGKKTLSFPPQVIIENFLDRIYRALGGSVSPHTYGKEWILIDDITGKEFPNIGTAWARSRGMSKDDRRLNQVGFDAGTKLKVDRTKGVLQIDPSPLKGGHQEPLARLYRN